MSQASILRALQEGPQTVPELQHRLLLSDQTVRAALLKLKARGLVRICSYDPPPPWGGRRSPRWGLGNGADAPKPVARRNLPKIDRRRGPRPKPMTTEPPPRLDLLLSGGSKPR